MRLRHRRADRDVHRRHRGLRRRDDRGNHPRLQVRRLVRRRPGAAAAVVTAATATTGPPGRPPPPPPDRGLRERAAVRRDDRPQRAGRLADEGACCRAKHRGEVRHRVVVEPPGRGEPPAPGRRTRGGTLDGRLRRERVVADARGPRGGLGCAGNGPRPRAGCSREWHLGRSAVSLAAARRCRRLGRCGHHGSRRRGRRRGRARQASGPRAWVAHWPRWHRCRQRLAWPQARPVRLHRCLPPWRGLAAAERFAQPARDGRLDGGRR